MKISKILKWTLGIGFAGLVFYSLSEEKINELKYGKEYTSAKRTIDSAFFSNLDFIKKDYFVEADGVKIGSPEFQKIKENYQKKEAILTENWYNNIKKLENSSKR